MTIPHTLLLYYQSEEILTVFVVNLVKKANEQGYKSKGSYAPPRTASGVLQTHKLAYIYPVNLLRSKKFFSILQINTAV